MLGPIRLVEDSGHLLANKIRNSVHYMSLFRGVANEGGERRHRHDRRLRRLGKEHHALKDEEVIEALVQARTLTSV